MIIERTNNEVIFRLPGTINVDDLQDMTDLFEFMEIAKKSKAKQKDVDELVKSIKKGRWKRTKAKISV
ncbi:MAG: hypothetical protein B6D64_08505 [Bacteroidetes bacterium 4484_276]|nr:MAG: hypothetical protein B6D64_08505 [Bacteroidetes bacterium 4484_276]OYT14017.1 MAG: hypothetical protein B6I19_02070 [Bacteroidetes bacterium 4572_114]